MNTQRLSPVAKKNTPVFLWSLYRELLIRDVEASFMRQGVSDYLLKPVDVRTLIASVGHAIEQRQLSWA